jgi:molybdopterin-guanine dinucleotide biosynthesis protein A
MGADKARIVRDGLPLAEHAARALAACVEKVHLVLRPGMDPPCARPAIFDAHGLRAPLVGIAAALRACEASAVLVAACDQPELEPALLLALLAGMPARSGPEIVACQGERGPEVLPAVFAARLLPELERRIERRELALHLLLRERDTLLVPADLVRALDPDLRSFRNLNRPSDLAR